MQPATTLCDGQFLKDIIYDSIKSYYAFWKAYKTLPVLTCNMLHETMSQQKNNHSAYRNTTLTLSNST